MVYEPRPENIWIDEYLDEKQSEITRYVQIVFKRKWLVLSVVVAFVAADVQPGHTPRCRNTHRPSRFRSIPNRRVLPYKEIYESVTADPRYLGTQAQVLKSEVLARRIVTRLNLAPNPDRVARRCQMVQVGARW